MLSKDLKKGPTVVEAADRFHRGRRRADTVASEGTRFRVNPLPTGKAAQCELAQILGRAYLRLGRPRGPGGDGA